MKTKNNIKPGSKAAAVVSAYRLTDARRAKIRAVVAGQFSGAKVTFHARGNPNDAKFTPVHAAKYFAVYIRNGAVLLRGSTISGLDALASVVR